ncbi:hypothetical protein MMC18_000888 [Xylographa bjoerkii]|nr:hypothetical protein [Xylographa bjoerkii]
MLNSDYKLTFGVELELIFVFHEKLLIGQLRIEDGRRPYTKKSGTWVDGATLLRHQATLRKDLSQWTRQELRQGALHYRFHNPIYLGWGLTTKRGQAARQSRPFTVNRVEGMRIHREEDDTLVRTYDLEPVRLAREVLLSNGAYDMWRSSGHPSQSTGLRIGVRSGEGRHKPVLSFRYWHVTNDFSLSGLGRDELAAYLEKYKVCNGRDGDGASPFSNGLALNSLTNVYRPASETASARSQGLFAADLNDLFNQYRTDSAYLGNQGLGGDILSALDNYLNTAEQDLAAQQQGSSNSPTSSIIRQDGSVIGKRKPGSITNEPLSKRTRLSASPEFGKKQTGLPDVNDWDAYGIELVSKVLRPVPEDFETIARFCDLLKGEPCHNHGATINDTCGLHVHLKPDGDNDDFDLNTLQHFAYIITIYETEIEELHPFHRRTYAPHGASNYDFKSNTQKLQNYSGELDPFREIQEIIGSTQDEFDLGRLMGEGKGYIVNFSNLLRDDPAVHGPRTIEFRQHEGVLRGEMVEWWVKFCIGLLQLANHAAFQQDNDGHRIVDFHQQCEIYPFEESNDCLSVWDLFDLMDFPGEGRRYFQRRAAYFADFTGGRDATASLHTSDYGYKGPQRYMTPDAPSHSDLTSFPSDNTRRSSLMNQIVRRVHQHLQATQASHGINTAAISAHHPAADGDKATADGVAADKAVADKVAADRIAEDAARKAREKAKRTLTKAEQTLKAAGTILADDLTANKHPIPRPDSPNPFNPLPHTSITHNPQSLHLLSTPTCDKTPPTIQPWIPINSPQGEKVLKELNLPGLTGTPYQEKKTKPRKPRRNSINQDLHPKKPRSRRGRLSSTPSTSSPLRNVTAASPPTANTALPSSSPPVTPDNPALPTRPPTTPQSPYDPSVLPSYSPPGATPEFQQQSGTSTPAPRPSGRTQVVTVADGVAAGPAHQAQGTLPSTTKANGNTVVQDSSGTPPTPRLVAIPRPKGLPNVSVRSRYFGASKDSKPSSVPSIGEVLQAFVPTLSDVLEVPEGESERKVKTSGRSGGS